MQLTNRRQSLVEIIIKATWFVPFDFDRIDLFINMLVDTAMYDFFL